MGTVISKTTTLDMRGNACALILARAKMALKEMATGDVLEVLSTDSCTEFDLPSWTKRSGNEMISAVREGDYMKFTIQKG